MANNGNLIPGGHKLTLEEQSAGGKASAASRRRAKNVQNMLSRYFSGKIKDDKQLAKLAAKVGIDGEEDIKYLYIVVCSMNALKKGDFKDIEMMAKLLGETAEIEDEQGDKQTAFLEAIKKAVTSDD